MSSSGAPLLGLGNGGTPAELMLQVLDQLICGQQVGWAVVAWSGI